MRFFMAVAVFFIGCSITQAMGGEPESADHSIALAVSDVPIAFGRPVVLEVRYRNEGKEPWIVPMPAESTAVLVRYRAAGTDRRAVGFPLGRTLVRTITLPNGRRHIGFEDQVPEPLSIPVRESHGFKVKFKRARDWNTNVVPGRWAIWVHDEILDLESNRVEIPLHFTADSVEACLEIAADKNESVYKRFWHTRWLQRIDPDLKLIWPARDATDDVKASREAEIQRSLKEFASFWKDAEDSPEVAERIAQINREAGLEP